MPVCHISCNLELTYWMECMLDTRLLVFVYKSAYKQGSKTKQKPKPKRERRNDR